MDDVTPWSNLGDHSFGKHLMLAINLKGQTIMSKNIPAALAVLSDALTSAARSKADLHKAHVDATNAGTTASTNEAAKALGAVQSAEKLGMSTLNAAIGIVDVATGASAPDAAADAATVKTLDAGLAALDAAQKSLEQSRAVVDAALKAARDKALEARAQLAPKAPEKK
ncbi:MAG: hypothetical protein K2X77_33450 [Candidatus Obscuribacterales bacterium]|nr:hypothetical protein [Candidatus Obscuribacterales bacterium]